MLTVLCVMCFRYFRGSRDGTDVIVHTLLMLSYDCGSWIWIIVLKTCWLFLRINDETFVYEFLNWKFCLKNHVAKSWYQSLGLRDSDITSGISGLKLRIWEKFSKRNDFSKTSKRFQEKAEKSNVYNQPVPEQWFPKIPLRYVLWEIMRYVMHARVG